MSPRKYVPLVIGALLLAALLLTQFSQNSDPASIGKPDGKSPDPPVPYKLKIEKHIDINVNVSLTNEQFRKLNELHRDFINKYPYIQVNIRNVASSDEAYALWVEQSQQGRGVDVMLLDNGWVKPFAVRGFLKPTESMMTGDVLTDQMSALLDPLKWNGYIWGVPESVNPYIAIWNHNLLVEAGFKNPPNDWASFQAVTEKVMALNADTSIINLSPGDLQQQLVWHSLFQLGRSNIVNLQSLNKEQMERLQWLETIEPRISRIKTEAVTDFNEAMSANKLLLAFLPWNVYEKMLSTVRDQVIVDQKEIYFPWLNGRSYVISSSSDVVEEATLWIREMTNTDNQQKAYDELGQLPARASLYKSSHFEQKDESRIPPRWWLDILNEKQTDEQSAIMDPIWPERWKLWKQQWLLYSQKTIEMDTFLKSLNIQKEASSVSD